MLSATVETTAGARQVNVWANWKGIHEYAVTIVGKSTVITSTLKADTEAAALAAAIASVKA